jgi:spore maturation protein CgeB
MRILFSGYHNPHYETVTEYMERGIRALGHDAVVYDDRRHVIPGRVRYRFPALRRLDLLQLNRRLVRIARRERPDLAIVTGGDRILGPTVDSMNALGIVTALWTTDPPIRRWSIIESAPRYDHIFCQGTEAVEIFSRHGISRARWLPVGCEPTSHYPVDLTESDRREYGSDVVFVGSHYPEREVLLEALADFDLAIWGPGWEKLREGSPLKSRIRKAHTAPAEWLKIYSASRIVLATHYRDPEGVIPVHQASPRVFEALACRAFLICDRQRDVFSLFCDGEHLAGFDNGADLAKKVRYYLDHPQERQTIACKGHEEVMRRHTYVHRIEELLASLMGHDESK